MFLLRFVLQSPCGYSVMTIPEYMVAFAQIRARTQIMQHTVIVRDDIWNTDVNLRRPSS